MKKIQNKMHTLGERIQEYGMRISSFLFFSTQQLNLSTPQHFGVSISYGAAKQHGGLSSYGAALQQESLSWCFQDMLL